MLKQIKDLTPEEIQYWKDFRCKPLRELPVCAGCEALINKRFCLRLAARNSYYEPIKNFYVETPVERTIQCSIS